MNHQNEAEGQQIVPPSSGRSGLLLAAFFLSGGAGLTYEVVWTRYLGLVLGHTSFAQVLVIAVYLGGMALGALAVGQVSRRVRRPLLGYAVAELLLAVSGIAFHPTFRGVTELLWQGTLIPTQGTLLAAGMTGMKWGLAVFLVLPQSLLLGATFPLLAAGMVRIDPRRAGRSIADLYFWNTLGGAVGILVTGFVLVAAWGTPGALLSAAGANVLAAALAWAVAVPLRASGPRDTSEALMADPELPREKTWHLRLEGNTSSEGKTPKADTPPLRPDVLWGVLLGTSFLTAVASFMYEIGWIRMLSMVLGAATHSFEIMLSAFLLGLALGALLIRGRVDKTASPLRLLAVVQLIMGATALATLPIYMGSFHLTGGLVQTLSGTEGGYTLFGLARYGLALAVMLPSTVMAGMTLPLITGTLLRRGLGEGAIGWVYGINTFGSVTGVIAAGLILMPILGLKGIIAGGAALDMALGIGLLAVLAARERGFGPNRRLTLFSAGSGGLLLYLVIAGLKLDPVALTGGVFRYGRLPVREEHQILYYHDGRTASVGVHFSRTDEQLVLTTNGKPDASLPLRWLEAASGEGLPREPIRSGDAATQVLAPLVSLAHVPGARRVANIGQGSGMSGHLLLASPEIQKSVTIEIEPAMVRASQAFLPANRRVFEDPRSQFVFDDARSYLAQEAQGFDIIFSEPSNPWVSGVASLFTREFYGQVGRHLNQGGVFAQWIQLYELSDTLVLSVLKALHESFGDYRGYLVGESDLLVVATPGTTLPEPDWEVVAWPGVAEDLAHLVSLQPAELGSLRVFRKEDLDPLFSTWPGPANSDFFPHLDLGAEAARFRNRFATGVYSLALRRWDLFRILQEEPRVREPFQPVSVWVLEPLRDRALAAWLGELREQDTFGPEPPYPEWRSRLAVHLIFQMELDGGTPPESWQNWSDLFRRVETELHLATAGWVDEAFYRDVELFLDKTNAPETVRALVGLHHSMATWDFQGAAAAAQALLEATGEAPPLMDPEILLELTALAFMKTGQTEGARRALEAWEALPPAEIGHLRLTILRGVLREREGRP